MLPKIVSCKEIKRIRFLGEGKEYHTHLDIIKGDCDGLITYKVKLTEKFKGEGGSSRPFRITD